MRNHIRGSRAEGRGSRAKRLDVAIDSVGDGGGFERDFGWGGTLRHALRAERDLQYLDVGKQVALEILGAIL